MEVSEAAVRAAVEALRAGQAVVLPTDTVYGVAALASIPGAAATLAAVKDRAASQPIAVLVADRTQALALIAPPTPAVERLMQRCWPGPLTLVLTRSPVAQPLDLGGDPSTIGIRSPDHDLVRRLAVELGPLATTSANRHGHPTPSTAAAAAAGLAGPVGAVLDGGPCDGAPSTVLDCTGPDPRLLRAGALDSATIDAALRP